MKMTLLLSWIHEDVGILMLSDSRASIGDRVESDSVRKISYSDNHKIAVGRWGSPTGISNDRVVQPVNQEVNSFLRDAPAQIDPGKFTLELADRLSDRLPRFVATPELSDPFAPWTNPLLSGGFHVAGYREEEPALYRIVHGDSRFHAGPPIVQPICHGTTSTCRKTGRTTAVERVELRQWDGSIQPLGPSPGGGPIAGGLASPGEQLRTMHMRAVQEARDVAAQEESVNDVVQSVAFDDLSTFHRPRWR